MSTDKMLLAVAIIATGPWMFSITTGVVHQYYPVAPHVDTMDSYKFWFSLAGFLWFARLMLTSGGRK